MTDFTIKRYEYKPEDFVQARACEECGRQCGAFRTCWDANNDDGDQAARAVCDSCFADPAYDWRDPKADPSDLMTDEFTLGALRKRPPDFTHSIEIAPDGTITTLHADEVAPLVAPAGDATVARASHVEPDGLRWAVFHADGRDTGKRFATRADALAWERDNWRSLCGCES